MTDEKFVEGGSSKPVFLQEKVEWVRKPRDIDSNMGDYDEACANFDWKEVEKAFTWHETGKVNVVHECVDKHAASDIGDKVALWFLDEGIDEKFTFKDLLRETSKFGNALKKLGVKKGDKVATLMPRTPALYIAVLGINRIGAVPVPLFEAFMEQAIHDRMENSGAITIITTPSLMDRIPTAELPDMKFFIVSGLEEHILTDNDDVAVSFSDSGSEESIEVLPQYSLERLLAEASEDCEPEWLTVDDPLVIHYTSGSTGRSKGAIHRQYAMVGHYQTAKWALDLTPDDIYWCTADPGWVTGTSYGIYGPWTNGITSVVLGGRFTAERWYDVIQKCKVTMWYSAPTAYRMLMAAGEEIAAKYDFSSIRHICSVGEPLNPEALRWITKITGHEPHETWWMTETGMQLICNYRSHDFKIGCTGKPFPGTYASVCDDTGAELPPYEMGYLCIKPGWPAMMTDIYKNKPKYEEYFSIVPGWYCSGDSAYRDEDGYLWYAGRVDDVIKTSGERVGPFEVESALVQHPAVAEAGVIGKPDQVRGQIIKAFVSLRQGYTPSDQLKDEIAKYVRKNLAAHCMPREIDFVEKVPKTRSGKIMRRVLKAWDLGLPTGDISTMED